uniref:Uncharacterized protein n=1 Tax=Oryza punctata TaxID=4537 RepID=A0A0E0MG46_ORYPU
MSRGRQWWRRPCCEEARPKRVPVRHDEAGRRGARKCGQRRRWSTQREARPVRRDRWLHAEIGWQGTLVQRCPRAGRGLDCGGAMSFKKWPEYTKKNQNRVIVNQTRSNTQKEHLEASKYQQEAPPKTECDCSVPTCSELNAKVRSG